MPIKMEDLDKETMYDVRGVEHRTGDWETPEMGEMLVKIRDRCMAEEYVLDDGGLIACLFHNLENVIYEARHLVGDIYGIQSWYEDKSKDRWWSGDVDKVFQKDLKDCYFKLEKERYGR